MRDSENCDPLELLAEKDRAAELQQEAATLPALILTLKQECDLEQILTGGFAPLNGFMNCADYSRVCDSMSLGNGILWPIPITLDVEREFVRALGTQTSIALYGAEGMLLALMRVEDIWEPDLRREAEAVYQSLRSDHPGVRELLETTKPFYLGGSIEGVRLPIRHGFEALRHTPRQLRAYFRMNGWKKIVAFQTRNPMHRAHMELTLRAAEEADAKILIHPAVGKTLRGDIPCETRVACYQSILPRYPSEKALLSLLSLSMRIAGPREALWHAIVRENYGCTRFIVGRDHSGPGFDTKGVPFYHPLAAGELCRRFQDRLNIEVYIAEEIGYSPERKCYLFRSELPAQSRFLAISGREFRQKIGSHEDIPEWFSFPEIVQILERSVNSPSQEGLVVFFTGLPASGKSTLAGALQHALARDRRPLTVIDGDMVRDHHFPRLGFTRLEREQNVRCIGSMARTIMQKGGIAVCAAIAPYENIRQEVRNSIGAEGDFVMVYLATPLSQCEARDPKQLYRRARAGEISQVTGIDDPYEAPLCPEIVLDTSTRTPESCIEEILLYLRSKGLLREEAKAATPPTNLTQ